MPTDEKYEWFRNGHHFLFERTNNSYEWLRKEIVNYGAEASKSARAVLLKALGRSDVFEVQAKVKTIQSTEYPPMTQSSLSFFDDFRIYSGIPVFVLSPSNSAPSTSPNQEPDTARLRQSTSIDANTDESPDGTMALTCSVFSADTSVLASAYHNGSILIWDAAHGRKKRTLSGKHRAAIADICFYKGSSSILIACDFSGIMTIWDTEDESKDPVMVDCGSNWEKTRMPSVEGHWPKLSPRGDILVCPVQVVLEKNRSYSGSDSRRLFSLKSLGRIDITADQSGGGQNGGLFTHFCILHVFDTRSEGIVQTDAFGDAEGKSYCWGQNIELQSMKKLYIPLLADSHDYTLSSTEISFDSKGLLIGVSSRPNGHIILWPDFKEKETCSYKLEGMVGKWSPCDKYIVSWDVPLKNSLKSEASGCFVWKLDDLSKKSIPCVQNGEHDHPRFETRHLAALRCPSGNSIYWCDFVSLSHEMAEDTHLGVATCSIGDSMQIVLWDFHQHIPLQTFCPGISPKDVILHTQQAWADKWVLVRPSWGLNFISTSGDRKRLGFFAAGANKGIIYDTEKRIERLWISLKDTDGNPDSNLLRNNMDFVLSPKGDKFLITSEESVMIWLPQVLQTRDMRGVSWISLQSSDTDLDDGNLRCKFSRDGKSIGLMRIYGSVLDVWDLDTGKKITLRPCNDMPIETAGRNAISHKFARLDGIPTTPAADKSDPGRKWFCQFCISLHGDQVATCMGDMSVLLWDLSRMTFIKIAKLKSRYCAAWAVCFVEGPTGHADQVVVCEGTGHLVWIAIHPYPRVMAREDAGGQKRCSFSANGRRAVLMPDDIQVRVWDLVDRVPLFKCTYQVFLGKTGQVPFPHNVSLDGKSALVGIDSEGHAVLCSPETTYSDLKDAPADKRVSQVPNCLTVNEATTWFVTDQFHPLDLDEIPGERETLNKSATIGSSKSFRTVASSSSAQSKVRFGSCADGRMLERSRALPTRTTSGLYPDIKARLTNEHSWDYLRAGSKSVPDDLQDSSERLIIHSVGTGSTKQIFYSGLNPDKFIVMSEDGTKVACMGSDNKLNVWSAHSTFGCIPTAHSVLSQNCYDTSFLESDLDRYGPGVINYQDHTGLSLPLFAVYKKDVRLLDCLLSWAKRNDLKVSLRDEIADDVNGDQLLNALNLALGYRSPEVTRCIMRYLLDGVCTEMETSVILKDSLVKLSGVYPSILLKILDNKRIMMRLHELTVPEWAFAKSEYKVMDSNQLIPTPSRTEEMWVKEKLVKKDGFFRRPAVFKRTSAYACVMPYPDIAQLGMRGILRPLLFNKVPHHIFATWPIRCVIKFKWGLYGKRLVVEDCVHYLALLFSFTLYALLIGFLVDQPGKQHSEKKKKFYNDGTVFILVLCVILALGTLLRKIHQMQVVWRSGGWKGILYWCCDYFNLPEIICYVFIVVLIPLAHLRDVSSRLLASLVATSCILIWAKTLYYAQAFKKTGPLVIMIREIITDIRFYLFLVFAIMMGFGIAFFVLFRNARFEKCVGPNSSKTQECEEAEEAEAINALFGSFDRTMITMFSMMLGEVSAAAELLFKVGAGLKLVGITMFISYMIAVTIVLLNLLIAIMGDGFDRVKATDMSYFLKKRAQIIDDMETGLSKERQDEISSRISTYLHVLMPKHKSEMQHYTGEWQGRAKDTQQRFKNDVMKSFRQYSESIKELRVNQERIERKLDGINFNAHLPSLIPQRSGSEIPSNFTSMTSRGHGGARPLQLTEVSESSDLEDFFGDDDVDADSD